MGYSVFHANLLAIPGYILFALNILIWGTALAAHAACTSFRGLLIARLVLGLCEGAITAGFLIVSAMFYTRREQTVRVGWWCESCSFFFSFLFFSFFVD